MVQEKNQIIKIVRGYIKKINKYVNIDKNILFRSRAIGDARHGGDVDIIIISDGFKGRKSFERPKELYLAWGDNYDNYEIDIICPAPEEFEIKKKQIGVVREVVKEGIEIK